jgi:phosphomannomutase/phosphoglucomutase
MKLGKKNSDSVNGKPDVAKQDVAKQDVAKPNAAKTKTGKPAEVDVAKNGSARHKLTIYQVYILVALLIPVALAALLANFSTFGPAEQLAQNNQRIAFASAARALVEQRIAGLKQQVEGLSKSAWVIEALKAGEGEEMLMSVLPGLIPHAEKVVILRAGSISRNLPDGTVLPFAGLDMLKRVSEGTPVHPEAFLQDNHWYVQFASAISAVGSDKSIVAVGSDKSIVAAGSDERIGVALVIFRADVLEGLLKKIPGRTEIIQTLGTVTKPVLSGGAGEGVQESMPLDGSSWTLAYQSASTEAPVLLSRGAYLMTVAGGLLIALLAVFMVFNQMLKRLRGDFVMLTKYGQGLLAEGTQVAPQLHFDSLFTIAKNLEMTAKVQTKKAVKAAEAPARANAPEGGKGDKSASSAAPMFQENDALDLDMMDGDDDLLGMSGTDETVAQGGEPVTGQALFGSDDGLEISEVAAVDVPASIFRAYDIRGIVGSSITPEIVRHIGLAIGSEAAQRGLDRLCVGFDGRLSSPEIAEVLISGINQTGVNVIDVGRVHTPVLYFSTFQLNTGSGVMITGSHNPANYNGFKIVLGGETLAAEDIQKLYKRIVLQDYVRGHGSTQQQDVRRDYLDTILNDIAVAAPLKVVLDAGNGIAGELGPMLVEELGCEVIPLHCDVDGNFPNHHPDPGKLENLEDLIAAVRREGADLGIAFDGDGDRIGVVTDEGKVIWPDRLLMLFAKDVVSRNPGADIIFDVKCSRRVASLISEYGGRPVMWKTGHSLIKAKMKETGALLAGEMSGHIFFKERWYGFDDALYSTARLLEIVGLDERSVHEIFDTFPEDVSTPEINIGVADENKFEIVQRLSETGQFGDGSLTNIDGVRIDYADGWGLCRASNTTPMLVLRFEADSEEALERIKAVFRAQLLRVDGTLVMGF